MLGPAVTRAAGLDHQRSCVDRVGDQQIEYEGGRGDGHDPRAADHGGVHGTSEIHEEHFVRLRNAVVVVARKGQHRRATKASRLLASQLYGVDGGKPVTLFTAPPVVLAVSLIASLPAARRGAALQPADVLRRD